MGIGFGMDLVELGFMLYWPLLVSNGLALVICLIAGPREWSRKLGAFFFWLTGGFLALVVIELVIFILETHLRDEGGMGFGVIVTGYFPVLIEFILWGGLRRTRLSLPPPA